MSTGTDASGEAVASFTPLRPALARIAYRMLGSVADAEDVVQEAFVRWLRTDRGGVRSPEAFLRRMVTRLCLDQLKSARHRRETYVGPWLPEPLVAPETGLDVDEDVTLPLLMALDRLSPLERAAFLLHDVFDVPFDEVAATLEREPAAVRQLAAQFTEAEQVKLTLLINVINGWNRLAVGFRLFASDAELDAIAA
jgi:RNA polymerase sigma-70 factor (ECF subfamily)